METLKTSQERIYCLTSYYIHRHSQIGSSAFRESPTSMLEYTPEELSHVKIGIQDYIANQPEFISLPGKRCIPRELEPHRERIIDYIRKYTPETQPVTAYTQLG